MRKMILSLAAVTIAVTAISFGSKPAQAQNHNMAGCGVGSVVIKTNDQMQILAATLNGIAGNQTFGITTGTIDCTPSGQVYRQHQQEVFVSTNFNSLRQEAAAGQGEKLDTFSHLLGCPAEHRTEVASFAREGYGQLFSADATPAEFLANFKTEMQKDENLARACQI